MGGNGNITQYRELAEKYNVSSDHLGVLVFRAPKVLKFCVLAARWFALSLGSDDRRHHTGPGEGG